MTMLILLQIALFVVVYFLLSVHERTIGLFASRLTECRSVVDLGSGSSYVPLLRQRGMDVQLFDTHAYPPTSFVQPAIYDGEHIPLPNKSVDACVAFYSLHKSGRQNFMLQEMKRLARKYIFVMEDVLEPSSRSYLQNNGYYYHTVSEWQEIFRDLGVEVVETRVLPAYFCPLSRDRWWYPVRKVAFVLRS